MPQPHPHPMLARAASEAHRAAATLATLADALLRDGLVDHAIIVADLAKRQAALSYDCLLASREKPPPTGAGGGRGDDQ